jgi:hypothetical protein
MIGLFVDAEGNDYYGSPKNNSVNIKSTSGLMADLDIKDDKKIESKNHAAEEVYLPLSSSTDSLFAQASASYLKFQNNVEPARKKIAEMRKEALPYLQTKFNTDFPRERLALEEILVKMYDIDTITVVNLIIDSLNSENYRTRMLLMEVAGRRKVVPALSRLAELLDSKDWRLRAQSANKIGLIGNGSYSDSLIKLIKDDRVLPRAYAAYSLAVLNNPSIMKYASLLLNDSSQIVRTNFLQGILKSDLDIDKFEALSNYDINSYYRNELAKSLRINKMNEEQLDEFKKKFKKLPRGLRETIYLSLLENKDEECLNKVKSLMSKTEKDKELQRLVFKKIEQLN